MPPGVFEGKSSNFNVGLLLMLHQYVINDLLQYKSKVNNMIELEKEMFKINQNYLKQTYICRNIRQVQESELKHDST